MLIMQNRIGTYVTIGSSQEESYRAYVPIKLLSMPQINLQSLNDLLEKAQKGLELVSAISDKTIIPNPELFLLMYQRKEALLSSQIEGTQSSFADLILFENNQDLEISAEDTEEPSNYIKAMKYGLRRMKDLPMSLRLLREIHEILLSGVRGKHKSPGEFRRSQNWIGGTAPKNALFVPPPPHLLMETLDDFEKFLHDDSAKLPSLIKIAIAHVQFETIHPFLDGNGRLGRLLITLMLCQSGMLRESAVSIVKKMLTGGEERVEEIDFEQCPILYLSLYFKQNRETYYNLLQEVRTRGAWETWIEFFLEGVYKTSQQILKDARRIYVLLEEDAAKIAGLGRSRLSVELVFEYLKKIPQASMSVIVNALQISAPTAIKALQSLEALGIAKEITGKQRDRVYVYRKYLDILAEGTEPL